MSVRLRRGRPQKCAIGAFSLPRGRRRAARSRHFAGNLELTHMVSRLLNYGTWIRRAGGGLADRRPRGTYSRTAPVDVEAEPSAASHDSAAPGFAYALHMT